jgi:hypothetical protein
MNKFLIFAILSLILLEGCAGTGFDKRATLVPDSVTFGYIQEKYKRDPHAWDGFTFSATWLFR